jgi:hypothetical protein
VYRKYINRIHSPLPSSFSLPLLLLPSPFFKKIIHLFTCAYMVWVISPPCPPTLSSPPPPSPPSFYPLLNMTCFTFLSFIVYMSVHYSVEFCHGILSINMLCLNQSNPSTTLPSPFSPTLCYSTVFSVLFLCLVPT